MINKLQTAFLVIFITLFLLPLCLSGAESPPVNRPANIFQVIENIENINTKIAQATAEVNGKEKTGKEKEKISSLINQKLTILESIPARILEGEIFSAFQRSKFKNELKQLEVRIDTNSRLGYDTAVIRDEIKIDYLMLNQQIDSCCKNIKEVLHKEGVEDGLLKLFTEQQKKLAAMDLSRYEAALASEGKGDVITELRKNLAALKARRTAFSEILSFFSENTMLLTPEVFSVGSVSLENILDRINSRVNFRFLGINPGKLVISTSLLLLAVLLYMAAVKAAEFALRKYLVQDEETDDEQDEILRAIRKPIGILLILYASENIIRILFFPAAISSSILVFFDLLKLTTFVWAAFVVIRTYGELSASQLLKRKDTLRREIIGLGIKISYFIIVVIAIIIALKRMNYDISAVLASLGIGGLAMALAARDTLANFLSSVTILITNPFSLGDWIETETAEGTVVEVGLRQTTIRTFDNSMLFVPNSMLSDKIIRNWSRRKIGRRIKIHIGLPNDSSLDALKKTIKDIRKMLMDHAEIASPHRTLFFSNQNWLKSRKNIVSPNDLYGYKNDLMVYIDSLGTSTIDILIYCFSRTTDWDKWLAVKEDVLLKTIEIIRDNGLELAVPAQNIQFHATEQRDLAQDHNSESLNNIESIDNILRDSKFETK